MSEAPAAQIHEVRKGNVPPSKTAVTLQIIFVERPVDDPLLGARLWDEVDQIGALSPEQRQSLVDHGFRIGRVGANPPLALQTLMGLSTEVANDTEKRLVGRRVVLPSGGETEINTAPPHPQAEIRVPTSAGDQFKTYENVRGAFRMQVKRLQPGWVRVEFLPELHHGKLTNRPVPHRGGWQVKTTQAIERLYGKKFSMDLNLGEMVIVTGDSGQADSLGRLFFHSPDYSDLDAPQFPAQAGDADAPRSPSGPGIQRLLIIRLADLSTANPFPSGH